MAITNYFRRKSQNLSTAIESIYGLKINGETDKCLQIASETFTEMLDVDLEKLLSIDNEYFIAFIEKLDYSVTFLELLTKLIIDTAVIYKSLSQEVKFLNLISKGVLLLKYLNIKDKTYSAEREEYIIEMEGKMNL